MWWVLTYLSVVNGLCWAAFGLDKYLARRNGRRISERSLLGLAALGGSPAAFHARFWFRHKTRKQPFARNLHMILMLQAGLGLVVLVSGLTGKHVF